MTQGVRTPPFGMSSVLPAFDRATWLAKTLFGAMDACIVLVDGDRAWRSRDPDGRLPPTGPTSALVISSGMDCWVEDAIKSLGRDHMMEELDIRFWAGTPIRLADGSTPGALCVFDREPRAFDATLAKALRKLACGIADECDRARAAEAAVRLAAELDDTRTLLAAFVEAAPTSFVMTDRNLRLITISPGWRRDFGWGDGHIGRTLAEVAPGQYAKYSAQLDQCLSGQRLIEEPSPAGRAGPIGWIQTELTPWRDSAGDIGGVIVSAHDVTRLVETRNRVERSDQRLKMALDIADIYVYDIDYADRTFEAAGATDAIFDSPQTFEVAAKDSLHFVDPRDLARVREILKAATPSADGATTVSFECRVKRQDGQERWIENVARVVRGPGGELRRIFGAMQNITARKAGELALRDAKELAEAASLAKSTFLTTMSHEIRTPLNGVLGMAQAMAAGDLCDDQRERLAVIRQSGEALLAILNDVLDLSKIEAGKLELEDADFDIGDVARGAHAAFTAIAQAKGLAFNLTVEPAARGLYRGDSTRVRQIIYNLVSNGLKFTEQGRVEVVVDRAGDHLLIRVADTGIGIQPEHLGALFQKFEQADASTTRRFGGTGLGLAICRELVTLMGGEISVESRIEEGTVFLARLPLPYVGEVPHAADKAQAPDEADMATSPLRVLAAEDNSINQLVLKTLLHQIGITPCIVDNGARAVEAWASGHWDLILMDVQMPELDGPSAARIIRTRERAERRAGTPIIALTANVMAHQVVEYAAAGMDGFVAKPIEAAQLFRTMQEVLDAAAQPPRVQTAV